MKSVCRKNNVSYKQALKNVSLSYKTRNEKKTEEIKQDLPIKLKHKSYQKIKNIVLKF